MMLIYIVVVGGGLILFFDGVCYCVGFEFAGVNFGFVVYGKGGFLIIIDCNIMVGKI